MISHSPPLFSHSPPASFLSEFTDDHRRQNVSFNEEPNRNLSCRPQVITLASKASFLNSTTSVAAAAAVFSSSSTFLAPLTYQQQFDEMSRRERSGFFGRTVSGPEVTLPSKSCLRWRNLHGDAPTKESSTSEETLMQSKSLLSDNATTNTTTTDNHSRLQKRVVFADDEGLALTEVRIMSEPSNVPPYWSIKFLEQITQGLVSPHPADQWTVDFKQPASDYLSFRQAIEKNLVSLENVIVKDNESLVVGTVKVKNIGFQKEVIVRLTWDSWKSQQDVFCTYSKAYGPATLAHVVFDTFSFKLTLPPSSKRLEFCICYRANGNEFWDNNEGTNYTISKRSPFYYPALVPYEDNTSQMNTQHCLSTSKLTDNAGNASLKDNTSPYW